MLYFYSCDFQEEGKSSIKKLVVKRDNGLEKYLSDKTTSSLPCYLNKLSTKTMNKRTSINFSKN